MITWHVNLNLLCSKQREVTDYELLVASETKSFTRVPAEARPDRMPDAAERELHAEHHDHLKPALDALDGGDERKGFRSALQDLQDLRAPPASSRRSLTGMIRSGQVADDRLEDIVTENAERNTGFMKLCFDNNDFQKAIKEAARGRAYRIITEPACDEARWAGCAPRCSARPADSRSRNNRAAPRGARRVTRP